MVPGSGRGRSPPPGLSRRDALRGHQRESALVAGYPGSPPALSPAVDYFGSDGGTRLFVACSKAYASSMSLGSLHESPVKLTPYGPGFASKPAGNGGVGAFGTMPKGTITVG